MKRKFRSGGYSIIEVLVSLSLLGTVIASSSKVIILSMHANKATRTYASVVSDIQEIIDDYRGQNYLNLLSLFGTSFSVITNDQTVAQTITSKRSRAEYTVTLRAIKSTSNANPEALEVTIEADHRRGMFSNASYSFTTIISQAR